MQGKCDFAHGPLELRIKETRRDRWGKVVTDHPLPNNYILSGGEDILGAARSIEKFRSNDGVVSPYEKYAVNSLPMNNSGNQSGAGMQSPVKYKPNPVQSQGMYNHQISGFVSQTILNNQSHDSRYHS